MDEILKQIENLKGIFLLRQDGSIYIIKDFTIKEEFKYSWLLGKRSIIYITSVDIARFNVAFPKKIKSSIFLQNVTQDRMRYIKMSSSLKRYRCTIVSHSIKK